MSRTQLEAAEERALCAERQVKRDGLHTAALATEVERLEACLSKQEVRLLTLFQPFLATLVTLCSHDVLMPVQEASRACVDAQTQYEDASSNDALHEAVAATAAAPAQLASANKSAEAAQQEAAAVVEAAQLQSAAERERLQAAVMEAAAAAEAARAQGAAESKRMQALVADAEARAAGLLAQAEGAATEEAAARNAELEALVQRQAQRLTELQEALRVSRAQAALDPGELDAQVMSWQPHTRLIECQQDCAFEDILPMCRLSCGWLVGRRP